ncbi:hypothetical protein LCGC14_0998830 [marine sediment metagenome]|uniref:Uncharacterized protein n=1 Tax=marine sediment metagenome TaxID=412755 RepID=A0A0F9N8C6_9ZZZZ
MTTVTAYESFANRDGLVGIRNSAGKWRKSADAGGLLHYLRYSASESIRVVWDLDGFIAPVLRHLPEDVLERLSRFDQDLTFQDHELYYLGGRMFRVGKARFYGIRDFWGGVTDERPSLEEVHQRAVELLDTLDKIGLPNPRKLTSAIAVFEDSEWGKAVYESLPKGFDLPEYCLEMLEYAGEADGKDWVSNHRIGHFAEGEIWDYDIASSYPSIAARLPDLRDLRYWKSTKLGDREACAVLGMVCGSFTLDPDAEFAHCSPIIGMVGELPGNPLGKLPVDDYAIAEVRFVLDNGLGTFKMRDGWFAETAVDEVRYPLREIMTTLYQGREGSPLARSVTKAIANSLIGKMVETRVGRDGMVYGPLRNDLYHATITSQARIDVAQFLIDHQVTADELCCIQTDGVKLTRDIPLSGNGMGTWVNKGSSATVLLSPYKVYAADARPYRLTYADLTALIDAKPTQQRYAKTVTHRVTLVQAIRNYDDITRVGELLETPTSVDLIDLETEQNRVYPDLPRTGRGLLSGCYRGTAHVLE